MTQINTIVSGMRPTGTLHLGNYVGAIHEFLRYQKAGHNLNIFAADLHALTEIESKTCIRDLTIKTTRLYLACGLDPKTTTFYRQSDIRAISEIMLQLSMIVSEGILYRCTTYKDKRQQKKGANQVVSAGLLMYPILMCADIIAVKGSLVPVGHDQLQHLEMCRDFVVRLNSMLGLTLPLPNCPNDYQPARLPGLDGSGKMGKSDGNTISLLDDDQIVTRSVMSAVTDSGSTSDQQMSMPVTNLFQYMERFCPQDIHQFYLNKYHNGHTRFYGEMKKVLAEHLCLFVGGIRMRYMDDPSCSTEAALTVLEVGADRINPIADQVCLDIKNAMHY